MNQMRMDIMQAKPNTNATKVPVKSFKSILKEMMKLTKGGNLRVANMSADIFKPANNTTYSRPQGA